MGDENMSDQELKTMYINWYMDLQRIKKANKDTENIELDFQIKGTVAKLSALGINVEDIRL